MQKLTDSQQPEILELLGKCFPDYWEQLALKQGKMPFFEISFAEFDHGRVIGHCGIIPYEVWCGSRYHPMAGIASVAVDPDFRRRGIAGRLCNFAADWAKENGFVSLPLYTAHFRVYESCSWHKLDVPAARYFPEAGKSGAIRRMGRELSSAEKNSIIQLYENSPQFDGKVKRQDSGTLHSWERIFNEPEFTFLLSPAGYAIEANRVIVEANFLPGTSDRVIRDFLGDSPFYLPEMLPGAEPFTHRDAMHGERPMVRDLTEPEFHRINRIFFPVTDKF